MKIRLFLLFSVLFCGGALMAQQIGSFGVGGVNGTIKPAALSQITSAGGGINPIIMMASSLCVDDNGNGGSTNPRICDQGVFMSLSITTITINVSPGTIESTFMANLGVVNVVIKDTFGMVYHQDNVDTAAIRNLSINISMLPSGSYTIVYADTSGQLIMQEGFNIE